MDRRIGIKRVGKKALSIFLALLLLIWSFPTRALAMETDSSFVTDGSYSFTSNEGSNIQAQDTFEFREDCFMRSSHLGCCHLYELSASAALASTSWYGDEVDPYEVDPSDNARNIKDMLDAMGFEDVETNAYYTLEKLEDSAGVCVGHQQVEAFGKTYTLLAIIPRSAGYKREWAGNFTVGDGDIHEGFKEGRDEILRYVKSYINEHGITGSLKVWTTGHSRGSALANILGGFFAGGGIDYFDGVVSITPEDVYCYTFANPTVIKDGASKNEELSVAGARGGVYKNDTLGEAYTYTSGGTVDVNDSIYAGIRNYPLSYDVITMLPPEEWGFTLYGQTLPADGDGAVTVENMLAELATISPFAYDKFINGGDFRSFTWTTFDVENLELVTDESMPAGSMEEFMKERIAGLIYHAPTSQDYATNGAQDTLQAVAGSYGMLLPIFNAGYQFKTDGLAKPAILLYLAYATERLMTEGRAETENEAALLAVEDLLEYLTGEATHRAIFSTDPNANDQTPMTVDDFVYSIIKFIYYEQDGDQFIEKDTKLSREAAKTAASVVPETYAGLVIAFLGGFDKNKGTETPVTVESALEAYLRACVVGADPECELAGYTAEQCRAILYPLLGIALSSTYPEVAEALNSGSNPLSDLVDALITELCRVTNEDGQVVQEFSNLQDAADYALSTTAQNLLAEPIAMTADLYTPEYHDAVAGYLQTVSDNATMARKIITYLLFYDVGQPYAAQSSVRNAATFLKNASIVPPAHYNEVNLAWARAVRKSEPATCDHAIVKVNGQAATCTENGTREHWLYHEHTGDRFFVERTLATELTAAEIVTPATGHAWGEWTVTREPTDTEPGERMRICSHDSSHVETEVIPPTGDDSTPGSDSDQGSNKNNADKGSRQGAAKKAAATSTPRTSASHAAQASTKTGDHAPTALAGSLFVVALVVLAAARRRSRL